LSSCGFGSNSGIEEIAGCAESIAAWNSAIEYGLIAAGIALAIITAVQGVGTKLKTNFTTISTSLK
jgi:pilus assembly protein Flp/PilA